MITEEMKEYILTMMESKTYKINDDKRLKNLFTDEEIKINAPMTEDEIILYLQEMKKKCSECGSFYMYPFVYKENNICEECNHLHVEKQKRLWEQITEYYISKGMVYCSICNKEKNEYDRFHFDHINMFDKTDSVCNMVKDELDIDSIRREIDKCQLLCIHCHLMVTKLEHKHGFIRMKKELHTQNIDECRELYKATMMPIYDILRKNIRNIIE